MAPYIPQLLNVLCLKCLVLYWGEMNQWPKVAIIISPTLLIRNWVRSHVIYLVNTMIILKTYILSNYSIHLENHFVGFIILFERKIGSKIVLHQWCWFNDLQNFSINLLLISFALITDDCWFSRIVFKEFLLSLWLIRFDTCKIGIVNIGNIHLGHINLGGGSNHVRLSDSAKWNAVDFVWSSHQKKSRFQSLEAHDALATETTREKNADGAGGEGRTDARGIVLLRPGGFRPRNVIGGVVSSGFSRRGGGFRCLLWASVSENTLRDGVRRGGTKECDALGASDTKSHVNVASQLPTPQTKSRAKKRIACIFNTLSSVSCHSEKTYLVDPPCVPTKPTTPTILIVC